jgi:hypothetical protein
MSKLAFRQRGLSGAIHPEREERQRRSSRDQKVRIRHDIGMHHADVDLVAE